MVLIFYCLHAERLDDTSFNRLLKKMPVTMREKVLMYRRWQDRQAALFGKLLLLKAFALSGTSEASLKDIRYNVYNKPFVETGVDFNISHAGHCVVCAVSSKLKVGIDIEQIVALNIKDFENQWTPYEWDGILKAKDPQYMLLNYWTRKESVIKADGRGLSIPLQDISVIEDEVSLGLDKWFLTSLQIANGYISHLATDRKISNQHIAIEQVCINSV